MADFILASQSPRRVEILEQIGMRFAQRPAAIDESRFRGEPAEDYVLRMAISKARAVWDLLQTGQIPEFAGLPVLGADTIVVLGDKVFTQPTDQDDAISTLLALSGSCHRVLSAVALCGSKGEQTQLSETQVTFNALSRAQCERYWASGEPCDKAGAYAIQGLGAVFVKSIQGSYSGVVGLPITETVLLLEQYGVSCWNTHA